MRPKLCRSRVLGALGVVPAIAVALLTVGLPAAAGKSAATYSPPFTQCPSIGASHGCSLLIVFGPSGTTILSDPGAGAFNAPNTNYLVGVQNDSTATLSSVALRSSLGIFQFEVAQDGLCTLINCTWPHPLSHEGPNTSFEISDSTYTNGFVHFTGGLAPGASAYFDLEENSLSYATAPPTFAKTATVDSRAGDVCYYKPGAKIRPEGCVPVESETQIRVGSIIDTTKGQASLRTAGGPSIVSGGQFKLEEVKAKGPGSHGKRVTVFTLVRNNQVLCGAKGLRTTASAVKDKPVQRLFVKAKGAFRTQGQYSSGTVRGTEWVTEELCNGTRIHVFKGVVAVRDLVTKKLILVRAGGTYIAHAPK